MGYRVVVRMVLCYRVVVCYGIGIYGSGVFMVLGYRVVVYYGIVL